MSSNVCIHQKLDRFRVPPGLESKCKFFVTLIRSTFNMNESCHSNKDLALGLALKWRLKSIVCSHDVTAAMLEEKTKIRRPSWRSEVFFWGLNSIFMQFPPFVLLCKYGFWSHERTHSIGK